jgi:hypothetical protein
MARLASKPNYLEVICSLRLNAERDTTERNLQLCIP